MACGSKEHIENILTSFRYSQTVSLYNYIKSCFHFLSIKKKTYLHFLPIKTIGVHLVREKEDIIVAVQIN